MCLKAYGKNIKWLPTWNDFLQKQLDSNKLKALPLDIWNLLPVFHDQFGDNLAETENDYTWPILIEQFMIEQGYWQPEEY